MAKPGVEPQGVGPAHSVVPCEVLLLQRYVYKLALMGSTHAVIVGPVQLHTLLLGGWGHVDHSFRNDISLSLFY